MSKYRIVFTENAQADIRNIKQFIADYNNIAANKFAIKLKKAFFMIADYPKIGKIRQEFSDDASILFLPVMNRYLIVYTIKNGKIYILRVLSNYQNICALL